MVPAESENPPDATPFFAQSLSPGILSPSLFLPGLVAFLIAQGFYIAAFAHGVGFLPSRTALAVVAAFALVAVALLRPGIEPALRAPVGSYVAMLGLMVAQAAGRASVLKTRAAILVAVGAGVFMASDLTLAMAKFAGAAGSVDQATLPAYYLAQGLIAFFILPRGWSND